MSVYSKHTLSYWCILQILSNIIHLELCFYPLDESQSIQIWFGLHQLLRELSGSTLVAKTL